MLSGASYTRGLHEATRSLSLDRWADWGERERLVVNVASVYAELEPDGEPLNPLAAFQAMAELAQDGPRGQRAG